MTRLSGEYPPSAYYIGKALAIAGIWIGYGWVAQAAGAGAIIIGLFAALATAAVAYLWEP